MPTVKAPFTPSVKTVTYVFHKLDIFCVTFCQSLTKTNIQAKLTATGSLNTAVRIHFLLSSSYEGVLVSL